MGWVLTFAILALAGCVAPSNAPLVSAQFPPNVSAASQPQPLNSLPVGAANFSRAPNAVQPSYLALTLGQVGRY